MLLIFIISYIFKVQLIHKQILPFDTKKWIYRNPTSIRHVKPEDNNISNKKMGQNVLPGCDRNSDVSLTKESALWALWTDSHVSRFGRYGSQLFKGNSLTLMPRYCANRGRRSDKSSVEHCQINTPAQSNVSGWNCPHICTCYRIHICTCCILSNRLK